MLPYVFSFCFPSIAREMAVSPSYGYALVFLTFAPVWKDVVDLANNKGGSLGIGKGDGTIMTINASLELYA